MFPAIGDRPIAGIKAPQILAVLRNIEDRPAIESARRVRQRIDAVYTYAFAAGLAEASPAAMLGALLKSMPVRKRQPAILDLDAARQRIIDA